MTNPSCAGLPATCGPSGNDSCCAAGDIPAGSFVMGNNAGAVPEAPAHPVTLSAFKMDNYEVTVGRFRKFLDAYDTWPKPKPGDGAVAGVPASGWSASWNSQLLSSAALVRAQLGCVSFSGDTATSWTPSPGTKENRAINCATWYESFAFCIWDGGRLATEAEWEYAAVGGDEQRVYPWGATWQPAWTNYFGQVNSVMPVGVTGGGLGVSRWGQYDLMGNVWETVRDQFDASFYVTPEAKVANPVNVAAGTLAVDRGLSWYPLGEKRITVRWGRHLTPAGDTYRNTGCGFRCVR